ncbi:glycoside hydrolase family 5 protein [Vibrio variabilis]|uniref:glycoside hydrolase family 5 protein n=1 Tax=Vibrio variabilis TaxID=990271 RepID=UPI000DD955CB|nr:glycoside hydrolase family 5 protein [Vibrio variabilis]
MLRKIAMVSVAICSVAALHGCNSSTSDARSVELDSAYYTDMYAWNETKGLRDSFLGRGINMGNFLESPNYEGEWNGDLIIQADDFKNISESGFASVRVPVRWSAHTRDHDPHTIDEVFLARVQQVVDQAIQEGLRVIINTHHFDELFYDGERTAFHTERLISFWNQLSQRFPLSEYSEQHLVFEFLNEPHENIGINQWNNIVDRLTTALWINNAETQNNALGQRKVMIGTADWGGPSALPELKLPSIATADNTIITVHFYQPFEFTHQGAEWVDGAEDWIGTRWLGTPSEQQVLFDYLNAISQWNAPSNRQFEINIGEFGVYSQFSKAEDQRAWTAFIAREAEKRGFSWHYWEYSSGFGAYDPYAEEWRAPLIEGLIPRDNSL